LSYFTDIFITLAISLLTINSQVFAIMKKLNLPDFDLKTRQEGDKMFIFDEFRKKELRLTPEEWVRQNFIHYLVDYLHYPKSLISIEAKVVINGQEKRYDALGYDKQGKPFLLLECKAPEISLNQSVFDQASSYNAALNAPYVIVTNGVDHFCFTINKKAQRYVFLEEFPDFSVILS
jgi:hypothetical protein